ncbi:hypothetical protein DFJ74DRAFT_101562 [Hyaloraphidium curvatum]|nr:hypothetical protein DFJ74DRAFT_101562 [Hyaloraphidium curvatum]
MVHLLPDRHIDIPVVDLFTFVWGSCPESRLDTPAYIDGLTGASITFRRVRDDSAAVSRALRDPRTPWAGLARRQVACIYAANSLAVPALIYGVLAAGCAMTPSNPAYVARELEHQLRVSGTRVLFTQASMLPTAFEVAKAAGLPRSHIVLTDNEGPRDLITLAQLVDRGRELSEDDVGGRVVFSEDDIKRAPALLPFSSGTTGLPKAVALSHHNLVANVLQWTTQEGTAGPLPAPETRACFIPLAHMAGLMSFMLMAPRIGACVAIYPRFDVALALDAWSKYRSRYLNLVPPIAVQLAKADSSGYDFSAVESIMCGSAPLGPELERAMEDKFGAPVKQGWGMTETTCAGLIYKAGERQRPGAVGQPLPNMEVKVVDPETGRPVGFGNEGELLVKGPNIFLGYHGNEQATREAFDADGFFRTGDLVVCDEDRMFWVRDRLKELIKYNAFQIAPSELEDLLMGHPEVQDACVVGIPSPEHGEVPRAFVVLRPSVPRTDAKAEELRAYLDAKVSPTKKLRGGLEFVDEVPRGATGKILRRQVRDAVRARMAAGAGQARL